MPFHGRYFLSGFKDFVSQQERKARHLFHENAHEFVGLYLGGEKVARTIQIDGQSRVAIKGLKTPENHFRVAVAGMLGEAKGIKNLISPECKFDIGARFGGFAKILFKTVENWPSDPDSEDFIDPHIPMDCGIASTEWGRLTVADLAKSIELGMTEKRLTDALVAVAIRFNDDAFWDDFLAYDRDHQD